MYIYRYIHLHVHIKLIKRKKSTHVVNNPIKTTRNTQGAQEVQFPNLCS